MKDYYGVLQVSPSAEQEVIEAAYRRLARKYRPDVYSGPEAASRMRELNEAYEVFGGQTPRKSPSESRFQIRKGLIFWWRRGRIELPVQKKAALNILQA